MNNGIAGYVKYLDEEHKIPGNNIAVGMLGMQFFYMRDDFYAGQFTKTIYPVFKGEEQFDEVTAEYFLTWFNKSSTVYQSVLVRDFEKTFGSTKLELPVTKDGNLDMDFIRNFVSAQEKMLIQDMKIFWLSQIDKIGEMSHPSASF